MTRAPSSGIHLSSKDVSLIKGMLARGDRQHDIAAWFGVNGGRIAEIASGLRHHEVHAAPPDLLPPAGPYLSGRETHALRQALDNTRQALDRAEEALSQI